MTAIVTRPEWDARPPKRKAPALASDLATIHWEGPGMGTFPHTKCAAKVQTIQAYHMDTKGWNDIAYSAVVCPHGYVFEGRGRGARTGANGTNRGNDSAYAICALVGVGDPITGALLDGITTAVAWLGCTRTNAHRDWKPTACPGDVLAAHAHDGTFLTTTQPEDIDMTKDELLAILNDPKGPLGGIRSELAEVKRQLTVSDEGKGKTQRTVRHIVAADLANGD